VIRVQHMEHAPQAAGSSAAGSSAAGSSATVWGAKRSRTIAGRKSNTTVHNEW